MIGAPTRDLDFDFTSIGNYQGAVINIVWRNRVEDPVVIVRTENRTTTAK